MDLLAEFFGAFIVVGVMYALIWVCFTFVRGS